MKKTIYVLTLLLSITLNRVVAEGTWENYSNITQITDAAPVGDVVWVTCKGGVISHNQVTGERVMFGRGDAGLPSAAVEQIAVNGLDNVIWVGTYDAGVVEWDGTNWITYPFPEAFNLYRMKFDGLGNLWLQTNTGLFKFNSTTHEYTFVNTVGGAGWDFDAWDFDITTDNRVLIFTGTNCVVIDAATNAAVDSFPNSESDVVLSCTPTTVRLYGVDENTYLISNFGFLEFEFKDGSYETAMTGLPEFATVTNIERGADNELYAFVNGNEIYQLSGLEWTFVRSLDPMNYDRMLYAENNLFYFNEYVWMQSPDLIKVTDVATELIDMQKYDFTSNDIKGITVNDEGAVLMVSASKIYQYDATGNAWEFVYDAPTIFGSMYDLKFVNGNLYGVDYGNLIEYYDGVSWTHIPLAAGYSSIYIYDYCVTAEGVVYFVNDEGLFKSEDGVTENLIDTYDVDDWFISVNFDASRNLVWLGRINGIIKYDFSTEELINASDVPEMAGATSIQVIEIDAENNVWFGANNNRAYKYDGTDWESFDMGNDNDFIVQIAFDGSKTYFGLTGGTGGAYLYDSATDEWEYFNTSVDATMASNTVSQIVVSPEHDLWIAHADAGVSVYRTTTEPVGVIDEEVVSTMILAPNPASELIQIHAPVSANDMITVLDINGKIIFSGISSNGSIDISNFANGFYLLNIYNSITGTQSTASFEVQK